MSRPKSLVRTQSAATRHIVRKLNWLMVSYDFHTTPAPVPVSGPMRGRSNTARSLPTYAAEPCSDTASRTATDSAGECE